MDDAISAISVAKIQLVNAYELTLQLEQTGGNITELTLTLNEAGLLLSNAEHAYSIGDLDAAKNLAIQSQNLLEGFADKAGALKEEASQQAANDFWFKIIYPIFGSFAVIAVGFAVWYLLKRKYDASGVIENEP
ncbi:MAG: hypothetical protein NWE96_11235 [Candidatus Bathyarchaeota archaeon]|nr:hypothetical protein [Candidatus Bathyarchaeota archaeon]